MSPRIGSLFSGYGGLDMAVIDALGGGQVAWHSDTKPASITLLAHHWPGVPNLGDMTAIDYSTTEPIDVLAASWPCFVGDTIVMTARGSIPIREVVAGDLALTHRNRWRPVIWSWSKGDAPIQEVRAQGAPPVGTTAEHPFYVREFHTNTNGTTGKTVEHWGEPGWRPAEVITGTRAAIPSNMEAAPDVEWTLTPWLVGRWVADGWAELNTRRVKFAIGDDKASKFRAELNRAGVSATEYVQPGCIRFTIGNTDIGGWLVEQFGSGASGKRIPGWLLSDTARSEWLDGYLSGDGYEHAGASCAVTISRGLAVGVAMLGVTLGLAPTMTLQKVSPTTLIQGREVNQRPWYRVGLRREIKRQYVRWSDSAAWVSVRSSRRTGRIEQVWNIHVEEDNSYTADGLVVHNCQPHSSAGKRLGEKDPRALWPRVHRAIAETRPTLFFGENVARIAGNGELRRVVRSLAQLGYVGAWRCVRASDIGACHRRDRCFVVAVDATAANAQRVAGRLPIGHPSLWGRTEPAEQARVGDSQDLTLLQTPAKRDVKGPECRGPRPDGYARSDLQTQLPNVAISYTEGKLLPTPKATDGTKGGPGMRGSSGDLMLPSAVMRFLPAPAVADVTHDSRWGVYAGTIERHERALGQPTPEPTQISPRTGKPHLAPAFVEWMMMLPAGHVTGLPGLMHPHNLTRNQQLSLLGDGVVPGQAAYAFRVLLAHLAERLTSECAA